MAHSWCEDVCEHWRAETGAQTQACEADDGDNDDDDDGDDNDDEVGEDEATNEDDDDGGDAEGGRRPTIDDDPTMATTTTTTRTTTTTTPATTPTTAEMRNPNEIHVFGTWNSHYNSESQVGTQTRNPELGFEANSQIRNRIQTTEPIHRILNPTPGSKFGTRCR